MRVLEMSQYTSLNHCTTRGEDETGHEINGSAKENDCCARNQASASPPPLCSSPLLHSALSRVPLPLCLVSLVPSLMNRQRHLCFLFLVGFVWSVRFVLLFSDSIADSLTRTCARSRLECMATPPPPFLVCLLSALLFSSESTLPNVLLMGRIESNRSFRRCPAGVHLAESCDESHDPSVANTCVCCVCCVCTVVCVQQLTGHGDVRGERDDSSPPLLSISTRARHERSGVSFAALVLIVRVGSLSSRSLSALCVLLTALLLTPFLSLLCTCILL